jgi:hypothetical protein
MTTTPRPPTLRVTCLADLLAVVPHLLGFHPDDSLVVLGMMPPAGRVHVLFRYDLPDPPALGECADVAEHAVAVLTHHHITSVALVGYGRSERVTPVIDAVRTEAATAGLIMQEVLRVQDGRYWSYLCTSPSCCPPDGVPFEVASNPAAQAMAAAGLSAAPDRAALAATLAPATGPIAAQMEKATRRAEQTAIRLVTQGGQRGIEGPGLTAVRDAISLYRDGGSLSPETRHAWLALVLLQLPVRDDAWARMDPAHRDAHRRLWADVVRRAQPGYVAAPASLLAFTAWQSGEGALASIALERALDDDPEYSLALLLRNAMSAGVPPSMAVMPMTPEEVAASYADPTDSEQPNEAQSD